MSRISGLHVGFTSDRPTPGERRRYLPTGIGGYITARFSFLDARLLDGSLSGSMKKSGRSVTSNSDRTQTDDTTMSALRVWADAMTRTAEILLQADESIRLHQVARRIQEAAPIH